MSLRNKAVIVGVGESDIGKLPHMSGLGLNAQAARRAVKDAGLKHSDIDGLLTAYSFTEPYLMLGSVLAEYLGIRPTTTSRSWWGAARPPRCCTTRRRRWTAGRRITCWSARARTEPLGCPRCGGDVAVGGWAPLFRGTIWRRHPFALRLVAQAYMHKYGTTRDQMAAVAVNTRNHALMHPNAHMKKPITLEDVLTSKPISDPLNLLDCCLLSDAGGAFIVTTPEHAADLPGKPVWLAGIGECA